MKYLFSSLFVPWLFAAAIVDGADIALLKAPPGAEIVHVGVVAGAPVALVAERRGRDRFIDLYRYNGNNWHQSQPNTSLPVERPVRHLSADIATDGSCAMALELHDGIGALAVGNDHPELKVYRRLRDKWTPMVHNIGFAPQSFEVSQHGEVVTLMCSDSIGNESVISTYASERDGNTLKEIGRWQGPRLSDLRSMHVGNLTVALGTQSNGTGSNRQILLVFDRHRVFEYRVIPVMDRVVGVHVESNGAFACVGYSGERLDIALGKTETSKLAVSRMSFPAKLGADVQLLGGAWSTQDNFQVLFLSTKDGIYKCQYKVGNEVGCEIRMLGLKEPLSGKHLVSNADGSCQWIYTPWTPLTVGSHGLQLSILQ